MTEFWRNEAINDIRHWPDAGLVREGLQLFQDLPRSAPADVLLATDLHAGNVLSACRKPWLVIDPKPFIGDPAYDATQHLLNCFGRMLSAPEETIRRFADLLNVDHERVRLWMFARAAAGPRDRWDRADYLALARKLAC
jgi:streptomycin 6-kinase